jgi:hypothetical protein
MKKSLALLIFLSTASIAKAASEVDSILGFSVDSEGITYQVISGGCTKKADFNVNLTVNQNQRIELKLLRNKQDFCEAYLPYGTNIKFSWTELGLKAGSMVKVANPNSFIRVSY